MPDIRIPEAPDIRGLRFRLYEGLGDIPAMAAVGRAASAADGENDPYSVERMRVDYQNLVNTDPRKDCILAEVAGEVVAYARVHWIDNTDDSRSYVSFGKVHPAWRRRGIGTAMLAHNERRLLEIAATQPFAGERWLQTWAPDTDLGAVALFSALGYQPARSFRHMVRPDLLAIHLPPLPAGLEVRPVTQDHARAIFDAACEAFRDHFGERDESDESFRSWIQDPSFDPSLIVVAFDGDQVAGAVQGSIDPEENAQQGYRRGWTDPIFVRRAWRRRGLASALLGRALVALRERGMTSAQLDVDAENPNQAVTLYERHGFGAEHSSSLWRRPLEAAGRVGVA